MSGTVSITFTDNGPVVVEVDGTGTVHGLQIATAKLIFQTNGYFEVDGNLDLDLDVAEYSSSLKAFVDLPGKEFSAELSGGLSVGGYDVASADGIISSKGVGACGKYLVLEVGFTYPWGGSVHPMLESCDFGPLRVQPVSAASASAHAHAAIAAVPVAAGTAVSEHLRHRRGRRPERGAHRSAGPHRHPARRCRPRRFTTRRSPPPSSRPTRR